MRNSLNEAVGDCGKNELAAVNSSEGHMAMSSFLQVAVKVMSYE